MAHTRGGSIECRCCGVRRIPNVDFSFTGLCPACGESGLVDNIYGLIDKGSVPYKLWKAAWEVSRYGRPRNTTPDPGWIPRGGSIQIRHTVHGKCDLTFTE